MDLSIGIAFVCYRLDRIKGLFKNFDVRVYVVGTPFYVSEE